MDPIEIIAFLSAELVKAKAEVRRLRARPSDDAGLDLEFDAPLGHDADAEPPRIRPRGSLQGVGDPLGDDAEMRELQLRLSDKFTGQPKQAREVIRALVKAYPRFLRWDDFAGQLTTMREVDSMPTLSLIANRISLVRKEFGEEAVESRRGHGYRAGGRLLMIFGRERDVEREADVDLAV